MDQATGLVIEVRSELRVPDEIDRIAFQVRTGGPVRLQESKDLGDGPGRVSLPLRFALVPEADRDASIVDIEVRGLLGSMDVVTQAVV
jgi:hypothetical protein